MIWISYYKMHLQYLWSSYFLPLIIIHLIDAVKSGDKGECLQIFQCPELTADLFNLTVPDFAAKYHLRCSKYDSGYQGVCCPTQDPSFNTIIQNYNIERTQVPLTSMKTVTYTEYSTIPHFFTKTETLTDISKVTVTDIFTQLKTKVTSTTIIKTNIKTETEKLYETLTNTLTKTVTNFSTQTITDLEIQYDTKEITQTETIYVTDTFTEKVLVTQVYFRPSKMQPVVSTVTVTLPPVTTTILVRTSLKVRPVTRYPEESFIPVLHKSETTYIAPVTFTSGPRTKKHSQQKKKSIPDGFVELFGRVVLLPKTGDSQMNWTESVDHCQSFDSQPFVPQSAGDWIWLQDVAKELDDTMWIPATDLDNEGSIIWTDNTVAAQSWISWWQRGGGNREADDCMLMWNTDAKVEMVPCSYIEYPPVCQL